jgi:hypothetical protein
MATLETGEKYYLGRLVNPATAQTTPDPLLFAPDDLTTHAVVVGMTGSGKTGLCIDLLEEAALAGVPALMIDPKGDIANALLHFPDLRPQDFQAIPTFGCAAFHAGLQHPITIRDSLKHRGVDDEGFAAQVFECDGFHQDMTGHPFEFKGVHHPFGGVNGVIHPMKAVFAPVGFPLDVAPEKR